jgi:hypothetical protein
MRIAALIVLALIAAGVAVVVAFYWSFTAAMNGEVARLVTEARPSGRVVTEEMLGGLPSAAQRYLRYAGVVGEPVPRLVRLTQTGRIRSGADVQWMTFEAEETYSIAPPAFVWRASFPTRATPVVLGRDIYLDGNGSILMKILGMLPLADEHGNELKAAGLMRYLNEMMWFPAAFLGDNVEIIARDEGSFTVRLTDRGLVAEATLFIDDTGRLTNFQAERYNTTTSSMQRWETPISDYAEFSGYKLPKSGAAVWRSREDDLTYIELDVTSVSYED